MTHPRRIALLTVLMVLGFSLGTLPAPSARAVVGAACPTGQNAECGDPLQVCRNNTCVSLENEPLEQLPIPPPPGETGPVRPGPGIANFVRYVYLFGISFIGVAAVLAIFYGGLKYFFSVAGGAKEDAKEILTSAALGLLLALGAYLILRTINPALVSFQPIEGDLFQLTPPSTSSPFAIGSNQQCYPSSFDNCDRGLSCQGVRNPETRQIDFRCLASNLPPIGPNQECSERPYNCASGSDCRPNPANPFSATCVPRGAGGSF
ncbi:hypothetical protein HYW67_01050 [Candidatus Parcubacteria bacterium]|nr:hypothetical protein [Candidatus Parcubacteria bacterium]